MGRTRRVVIEFEAVSHAYGDRIVVRDVTLCLDGPRTAIIGANGSGKSTLARMINGLVAPSKGRVTVDGLDAVRDGAKVRRKVGFVFSDPDSQIVMPTVAEDVEFSLRREKLPRDVRAAQVRAVLAEFGLGDHHDHPSHQLSGGQKQLLALASVMAIRPNVLVLDEPTTLLDRCHSRQFMRRIDALDAQVVMVTHDLDRIVDWPRCVVVDEQNVVFDGVAREAVEFYCARMDARC